MTWPSCAWDVQAGKLAQCLKPHSEALCPLPACLAGVSDAPHPRTHTYTRVDMQLHIYTQSHTFTHSLAHAKSHTGKCRVSATFKTSRPHSALPTGTSTRRGCANLSAQMQQMHACTGLQPHVLSKSSLVPVGATSRPKGCSEETMPSISFLNQAFINKKAYINYIKIVFQ